MTNASQSSVNDGATETSGVTEETINALRGTKGWVLLIGILMFVFAAFTVLCGLVIMFGGAMAAMGAGAGMVPKGMFFGMGLMYIVMSAIYILLGWYLVGYSSAIGKLLSSGQSDDLEAALHRQRKFWKIAGILTLLMIALMVVGIVIGIGAAVMMHR